MKIGIDAYHLNKPNTSMGIFQNNILNNFFKEEDLEFHIFTDSYLAEFKEKNNIKFYISNYNIIKRNINIGKILNRMKIDVFFASFNIIPIMSNKKFRIVLQNHDWSHGIYSENLNEKIGGNLYRYLHKYSSIKANVNISNSEFTARETKKYANKDSIVIHHDADPFYKDLNSKTVKPDVYLPENYILYVGRVFPKYKNIGSMLHSYNKIIQNNKNIDLIIVHSDNYRKEDYNYIQKTKLNIIDLKSISRENVKFLYKNAFITLYPSLYEGFGSPILEAQSSGSPLIASNYGPVPEVAGNGAIYFNGQYDDLYDKISYVIDNPEIRKSLIKKGYTNASRFNWNYTAKKTLKVILNE